MIKVLLPALVAGLLCACTQTSLNRDAVSFSLSEEAEDTSRVDGLKVRFDGMPGPDAVMRILVVNGMATDAHGYSFEVQREIANRLGEATCASDMVIDLDPPAFIAGRQDGDRFDLPPATLRVTDWADGEGEEPRIIFYELLWTPYADAFTDQFLAPFETDLRYGANPEWTYCGGEPDRPSAKERRVEGRDRPPRALLNALLKDDVMVAGLTDAVLSVGPLGAAARDAIRQSVCIMAADALEVPPRPLDAPRCKLSDETLARFGGVANVAAHLDQHEFTFLTYSLGSFMLLDSLDEFRLWPGDLGPPELTCRLIPALLDDTPVYMFSNQVSLLLTAHPHLGCDPDGSCDLYGEFGGRRLLLTDPRDRGRVGDKAGVCRAGSRLQIVAFNDPNDIMGYRVPDYLTDSPMIGRVVNVRVRNPAFWLPGLLANPVAAHSNHGNNPAILDFIIKGWMGEPGS
ncbi:MAG: hypothetical protein RJQ02_00330 [Hyphomonas sp.]